MPRRTAVVVAAALAVYGFCCSLGTAGALGPHSADVLYYGRLAAHMRAGEIPYHTLYVEYPPGALPIFLAPEVSPHHYADLFSILMAVLGGLALFAVAACAQALRLSDLELARALTPLAVAPALLGNLFLNRYDPWPMLLLALAVATLLYGRLRSGGAAFALAALAKVWPLAAAPIVLVRVVRTAGGVGLRRASAVFVAVVLVVMVPFAILGPGGLAFSFDQQFTRNLAVESLGGSLLMAAHRAGVYGGHVVVGNLNSLDFVGTVPKLVGAVATLVALLGLLAAALWYARGRESPHRFVLGVAAAVVGYVAFGKVLSTQYVVWLLPVVPLARGRLGAAATVGLLLAMGLTNLESTRFDSPQHALAPSGGSLAILLARNLALVATYALLAVALRPRSAPRRVAEPVTA